MKQAVHSRSSGWLVGLVALSLLALTGNATPARQHTGDSSYVPKPIDVGMVALIAAPENYDGKLIRTHGFLHSSSPVAGSNGLNFREKLSNICVPGCHSPLD